MWCLLDPLLVIDSVSFSFPNWSCVLMTLHTIVFFCTKFSFTLMHVNISYLKPHFWGSGVYWGSCCLSAVVIDPWSSSAVLQINIFTALLNPRNDILILSLVCWCRYYTVTGAIHFCCFEQQQVFIIHYRLYSDYAKHNIYIWYLSPKIITCIVLYCETLIEVDMGKFMGG